MKAKKGLIIVLILLLFILFILIASFLQQLKISTQDTNQVDVSLDEYNPIINPNEFTSEITNKYFTLTPGKKMIYEAETEDGIETIEVYVTSEKKQVMGVEAIVVWDRVWLNNELIEDTKDWYAQDKNGNVWYFGEESKELLDGKVVSYAGSWEAGVDNAKPGIIMKANPEIGDSYKQEYYKGEAEDMADILAINEIVIVPYGEFNNCVKTLDYTPLEPDVMENKYYCPEIGGVVLEVDLESNERVELISLEYNAEPSLEQVEETEEISKKITEEEAIEIALKAVPGVVTDVSIEKKLDWVAYVIEIDAYDGGETDVFVDLNSGWIIDIET